MNVYRYSRWDGSQESTELSADELMDQLSGDLMTHGDVWRALQRLLQRGMVDRWGERMQGVQDLLQKLRAQRKEQLDKYNLNSVLDDIKKRLDQVIEKERSGIDRRLEEARQRAQQGQRGQQGQQGQTGQQGQAGQQGQSSQGQEGQGASGSQDSPLSEEAERNLLKYLEKMAAEKQATLDKLPPDAAGQLKELSQYDFMDDEARQEFQDLLKMLQDKMMDSYFKDLSKRLQELTPEQKERLKQMARELNDMLREKMRGGQPDFQEFMDQFGDMFGPNPPSSLDELMEQMQRQIAQIRSLLDSMPNELRQQLQDLVDNTFPDDDLRQELAELAARLEQLNPMGDLRHQYPFRGDESLTMDQAMDLMQQLQQMDELERQLRRTEQGGNIEDVDPEAIRQLLGDAAHQQLQQLQNVAQALEDAGYIKRVAGQWELTPRATRKIGQKALQDIFDRIKKDRFGPHPTEVRGGQGQRSDDTKPYEFGDQFLVDLQRTLMNAIQRQGSGVPVRLDPDDFEVYRTEYMTQSATVLMLDLSLSMPMRGNFHAAKKVALALYSLIKGMFPRDVLYILGFSDYAREIKGDTLAQVTWSEGVYGTNMHHAFMLARKLLNKDRASNKQIIMVTDGEPTAHIEGNRAYFSYPPSMRTIQETLKEAKRCSKDGIVINTFMMARNYYLTDFVTQLTKVNRGRAFFTTPDRLGQYILVDYLNSKRKRIA